MQRGRSPLAKLRECESQNVAMPRTACSLFKIYPYSLIVIAIFRLKRCFRRDSMGTLVPLASCAV